MFPTLQVLHDGRQGRDKQLEEVEQWRNSEAGRAQLGDRLQSPAALAGSHTTECRLPRGGGGVREGCRPGL